jgi:hypothetical protein
MNFLKRVKAENKLKATQAKYDEKKRRAHEERMKVSNITQKQFFQKQKIENLKKAMSKPENIRNPFF